MYNQTCQKVVGYKFNYKCGLLNKYFKKYKNLFVNTQLKIKIFELYFGMVLKLT